MYAASQAFHDAVRNGAHQIPLLIFEDAVFTTGDINVSSGIEFNDYFNAEEDLAIGQALSNELIFSIFNDYGMLNTYEFGDFEATIGAQIGEATNSQIGKVYVRSESHTYVAYDTSPYLTRDGSPVNSQPASPVKTMLIYKGYVYCLLENYNVRVYKDSNGAYQNTMSLNEFMTEQMAKWAGKGISYADRILKIWEGARELTYEFVPLGHFTAKRPKVPSVIEIHFECLDYMQKFEVDMPSAAELGITYPISIGGLLDAMCQYVGVQRKEGAFINSTAMVTKHLEEFNNVTMREVLGWIAEAAAGVARFDRDGYLVIDWIHDTNTSMDESGYIEFLPYWYETRTVTELCNRASNGEYDNRIGNQTGDTYLIQDNPLLKGVSG